MRSGDGGPRRAVLHLVEAGGEARHIALDRPVLHIGRAQASCGLVLAGPEVAAHHCCLRQIGGRWWLFDRGSAAGTFINSERCREPTVLGDGDRISIGLHVLELRSAPGLGLAQVLARLGGEAIALDFAAPPTRHSPMPGRPRGTLGTIGLAAAVGFAATLSIAADFAPEATPVASDMSPASAGFDTEPLPSASDMSLANADLTTEPAPSASDVSLSSADFDTEPASVAPDMSLATAHVNAEPTSVAPDVSLSTADFDTEPTHVAPDMSLSTAHFTTEPTPVPSGMYRYLAPEQGRVPVEKPTPVGAALPPETRPLAVLSDMSIKTADPTPVSTPAATRYLVEPSFELPGDALARGRPDAGSLLHALQLPPSPDYTIRCPAHAYASSATVAELMQALAGFRNRSSYRGELVVGDLSRADGGRYGPHRSHQSGRDVDLWLPVKGGSYRRGCSHCGTDLCRPEPDEVDWQATWELICALAARGRVEDVFLAWDLQPALREAARRLGAPEAALARQIQHPVRGRAALVKHAEGHTHHLHVRFRCPAGDPDCVAM